MIKAFFAAITISAGLSGPVFSADATGSYAVEGPGRMLCKDMTREPSNSGKLRDVAIWLSGYISAHNRLIPQTFDLTAWQTPNTALALMMQYCQANPEAIAENAARDLVAFFAKTRVRQEEKTVAQRSGDAIVVVYVDVMRQALAALRRAGFSAGKSDEELAKAITRFQKAQSIQATGLLDQTTLARLLQ